MSDELYIRGIAKVVVAQLVAAHGLDGVQTSTVDVLADLLLRYIMEVGRQSRVCADLAHRADMNSLDVAQALSVSGMDIAGLGLYGKQLEDEPFAQTIAVFPIEKSTSHHPTFAACNEMPPLHIPSHLPTLPDAHARQSTPQNAEPHQSAEDRQEQLAKQQHYGEDALLKMNAREKHDNAVLQRAAEAAAARVSAEERAGAPLAQAVAEVDNPFFAHPAAWEGEFIHTKQRQEPPLVCLDVSPPVQDWAATDTGPEAPGLQFAGWQWGGSMSTNAVISTRTHPFARVEDAYGAALEGEEASAPGGRRRLLGSEEAKRARVRELVASRVEEDQVQAYADALLDQEQI